jgi:DNA invertase Pin-like site-specific DNA recombinase
MRAAIYARISREDLGNIDNTDIQVKEGLAYIAEQAGWQHVATFVDDNISAFSEHAKRPDYERLLAYIHGNNVDVVVCTEPSRLNRRLWKSIGLFQLAESTDLRAIATTDGGGFDLSTKEGIHNAIQAAIEAEKESLRQATRIKRKKAVRAQAGRFNGGSRPYGYEADGLTIREDEAEIIEELADRLLDGESARTIVLDFRRRGIKTATGKDWMADTIQRIVESPRICGIRTHHGVEYPAQWPAIISREKWEQVRLIWDARYTSQQRVQPRKYLLTGVVTCGLCDTPMVGQAWRDPRRGAVSPRYRCPKDEAYNHRPGCGKVFRLAEPMEILVSEAVLYRLNSPDFLKALGAEANDYELKAMIDQQRADEARRDAVRAAYADGQLSLQDMIFIKNRLEEAMEARRRQMATMQSGRVLARIPVSANLRQMWDEADLDFQRDLIRLVVDKIIVLPGKTQRPWRGKYRFDPSLIQINWRV